jgi:hypothetical protein
MTESKKEAAYRVRRAQIVYEAAVVIDALKIDADLAKRLEGIAEGIREGKI